MQATSRRQFVKTLGAASVALAAKSEMVWAQSAEFTLKLGNVFPATHPVNVRAKEAADAIRQDTNGRVDLQLYPNSQLGGDGDMLSQVRTGAMDVYVVGLALSTLVPAVTIAGVGFAFGDYDHLWAAMDGDLGRYVRNQIAKVGLIPMDKAWDNGFRHITTSTKPIVTPVDLQNLRIRVPSSPLWTSTFKSLGTSPVTVNFAELYSALQTKIADAQENPLPLVDVGRLYEVQKFCSLTGHMWDGAYVIVNARSWGRLPKDLQETVAHHINSAGDGSRTDIAALTTHLEVDLKAKGLAFNRPDPALFRAALRNAGYYSEWRKRYGDEAWAFLEKYSGELA